MATKSITEVTSDIFALLNPFSSEDRKRVVNAVFVLLGESASTASGKSFDKTREIPHDEVEGSFGPKARHWLGQHRLTREKLEHVFYFNDGKVDIHLHSVAGVSRREQTVNCYLLAGAKAFLESDTATFSDHEAIALCKHTQAYDKNNHTKNRTALGNFVAGSREDGFTLTGPGLKAAAEIIGHMSGAKGA